MGTRFELLLAGDDEAFLRAAGESVIADIEETHARLTAYETNSIVARINASPVGEPVRIDGELLELLLLAERIRERSGGAFDIGFQSKRDGPTIDIDQRTSSVMRLHDRARVDLGSIGKGFGLDVATQTLRDAGVQSAFIQGGSSTSIAIGCRPDHLPWSIELRPGLATEALRVHMTDIAISISTNTDRPHVIDPQTGSPAEDSMLASCLGRCAAETDAWSTAMLLSAFPPDDLGSILWRPSGWTTQLRAVHEAVSTELISVPRTPRETGH